MTLLKASSVANMSAAVQNHTDTKTQCLNCVEGRKEIICIKCMKEPVENHTF